MFGKENLKNIQLSLSDDLSAKSEEGIVIFSLKKNVQRPYF